MNKLALSCIVAAVGIALGAFGAHALQDALAARGSAEIWRTAVLYHLIHAVALFALALAGDRLSLQWPYWLWLVGILLFSGSLYALALTSWTFLGPVTPLGGLALIAGWIALAFAKRV